MHDRFVQRHHSRPKSPYEPVFDAAKPTRQEQTLAAWAFTVGAHVPLELPAHGRRPHRGQLPDVDFSNIAPLQPNRSAIWSRIIRLLRIGRSWRGTTVQPPGYSAVHPSGRTKDAATF